MNVHNPTLLDYVDPAHSMDFDWSVFRFLVECLPICHFQIWVREDTAFSSTDKDESA